MTSAMTLGSLILDRGQYKSRVSEMTMLAWMMNKGRGSDGLKTVGLRPSRMPPWGGAPVVALAEAVAMIVRERVKQGSWTLGDQGRQRPSGQAIKSEGGRGGRSGCPGAEPPFYRSAKVVKEEEEDKEEEDEQSGKGGQRTANQLAGGDCEGRVTTIVIRTARWPVAGGGGQAGDARAGKAPTKTVGRRASFSLSAPSCRIA